MNTETMMALFHKVLDSDGTLPPEEDALLEKAFQAAKHDFDDYVAAMECVMRAMMAAGMSLETRIKWFSNSMFKTIDGIEVRDAEEAEEAENS